MTNFTDEQIRIWLTNWLDSDEGQRDRMRVGLGLHPPTKGVLTESIH